MIYLDNNATTPIDPEVFEVMKSTYFSAARNPSSTHRFGQKAKALLSNSVIEISDFFKVSKSELIFTSGATEAISMFLRGIFSPHFKGHLITSSLEHIAVFNTAKWLENLGVSVTYLSPEKGKGAITKEQVENALRSDTRLIALIGANNETGIKTELSSIAHLAQSKEIPLFIDGVALLGKEPFFFYEGISAACFSGHKIHGPLGVGLLVVKKGISLEPLIIGGPQQRGLRGGTENLPSIVGLSKAIKLLGENDESYKKMEFLRDEFESGIRERIPDVINNGEGERICNTSNLYFPGVDGEMLLMHLDLAGVAASFGSACSSGSLELSRILLHMGFSKERAASSLRFSLSRMTTEEDIQRAIEIISDTVLKLRI